MGKRTERLKSKRKKGLKIFLVICIVLLLAVGAYVFSIYQNVKNTVDDDIHETIGNIENNPDKVKDGQDTLNILLMGVDEREHDIGRADTLIVLSLNPNTDSMQMISIPRDTYTDIVGYGEKDKINHSYPFGVMQSESENGGTDMTVATVENFLDVELDYYVKMNMEGLTELVDAVGGITVNNPKSWVDAGYYQKGYRYEKGEIQLNGDQALGYVRMRKQDSAGDIGRNLRQRLVIQGIIDKGASIGSVTRIDDVLDVLGENMNTNMTFDEMVSIFRNYRNARQNQTSYQMTGTGKWIGPTWYMVMPDKEIEKAQTMIDEFNEQK
ncbi:cell envelope-related function transcriptional attenuator common domain-containing protein [Salinibacillus kushneri]|uniref:Cell envelope-related function transcriptional attenuator common domain-containing protein n=1 Tax=Salinibacillus kushneri TaxID=237682 RepID=A0A1H9YSW6_9BACI|nr:LCP family protein [Salinibacillus kushneri]SES72208.1 cell envelope-related function transcriptional attenuator common domain-containing protein [Salinibacillus kushneri]